MTQLQLLRTDNVWDTITTNDTDQLGAQLESIEPIKTEEQQTTIQPQIS